MIVVDIISCVLLAVGLFFSFVGVLGFLRMPDVYGRLQASTCIPSLGNICLILGGVVYAIGYGMDAATVVKLLVIMLMILCTNPISNHSLLKGSYNGGIKPVRKMVMDDYQEDKPSYKEGETK
jgi:multicomponent Na+:H+ antiporter subunit G